MTPAEKVANIVRTMTFRAGPETNEALWTDTLKAHEQSQARASAPDGSRGRRHVMKSPSTRWVAAAAVVAAIGTGLIGMWHSGGQAYAFSQTVEAMQGKRSFHIQTYFGSPTQRHDEFWAEFNERGELLRVRQLCKWKREDNPVETIWEDQVELRYELGGRGGICVISKKEQHDDIDKLEGFDPETMIEEINKKVDNGQARINVYDSPTGDLVVEATGNHPFRYVMLVHPETKVVLQLDEYKRSDDGDERYLRGIKVLAYNQPLDPTLFEPDFPDDTVFVDQVSGPVGMAEGDLGSDDTAYEVARQALEAWAAADYDTAGLLFGGASPEFFMQRASLKPVADIAIVEVNPYEHSGPNFKIVCTYITQQAGESVTIKATLTVKTEGQPGRWYIDPQFAWFSRE
jgi:hypothetical protein